LRIYTTTGSQRLVIGAYYTGGSGSACAIQSSDYYDGIDHPQPLYLNQLGGNVIVGTTTTSGVLYSGNLLLQGNGSDGYVRSINSNSYLYLGASNQTRITIEPDGDLRFNAYTVNGTLSVINGNGTVSPFSDIRLKKDINNFSENDILNKIKSIKPKTYKWIDGDDKEYLGYIAQEVEQVFPFVIDGKKYEYIWEVDENEKPLFDTSGNIVYKLDASGNKIMRPRGFQDRAFIAYLHLGVNALIDENASLKQQLTNLQNNITTQMNSFTQLTTQIDSLTSQNTALTTQIDSLTTQNTALTSQVATLMTDIAKIKKMFNL
jgi:hypothetical protein